jgi:hypothetical protein
MGKIKVNEIDKRNGSTVTLGGPGTNIVLGTSGQSVTLGCGATQTGFGRTGTVNWCTTAKTSPLTVASGNGYFINTSGGVITVTLPSSPSAGDIIALKDYGNTWDTNNVTLARNGSKINGTCECATLNTESQSVTLIYVDGTKGWQDIHDSTANVTGAAFIEATGGNTTITSGDFKTHIFTADGCFQVTAAGTASGSNVLEYFVVAGGGGGGGCRAGGGGAGGFRLFTTAPGTNSPLNAPAGLTASVATFPVTVGGGGPGATGPGTPGRWGVKGVNSVFSSITSTGGGGGGADNDPPGPAGHDGGSGGGAGCSSAGPGSGGSGNTPPVSPPQGNPGGYGHMAAPVPYPPGTAAPHAGGGGGGAGATGGNKADSPGGNGGPGGIGSFIADPFVGPTAPSYGTPGPTGSTRYFAGGGGGAGCSSGNPGASIPGGSGGGGTGDNSQPQTTGGTTNTGGGGGGTSNSPNTNPNGSGGSGIVMIRYKFQ